MNSPRTNAETRIDHALDALRHAEPRPGLEPRILHALESRHAHTPSLFAFLRLPSLRVMARVPTRFPVWTAATAVALITFAALLLHRPTPKPRTIALATSTPAAPAGLSPLTTPASTDEASAPAPPVLSSRTKSAAISSSRPTSNLSSRPKAALFAAAAERPAVEVASTRHLTREEAADLADLHAPSHPAPPLPLTPQEKALLHVVRYRNTTQLAELAALNPEASAARDAQEAAAFHAFFPDPPPLHQPGDTE